MALADLPGMLGQHRARGAAMIRADRELLAELARLNSDMPSFALRVMAGSADAAEQQHYAQRLIDAGRRLQRRAEGIGLLMLNGEVAPEEPLALPPHTVETEGTP